MSLFRFVSDNKNGTANIVRCEEMAQYSNGETRVRCPDGRVYDVGVRDTVWSPDLGEYVDMFYISEAQEITPND